MSKKGSALRVALIEKTGVVEIFGDPGLEIFQVTKVDDETVGISFLTGEGEGDCPVMPVYEGAVAIVPVLAVGEGDVAIGLGTSEHIGSDLRVGRQVPLVRDEGVCRRCIGCVPGGIIETG